MPDFSLKMHQIHFSVGAQPWVELAALPQTAGFLEKKEREGGWIEKGGFAP